MARRSTRVTVTKSYTELTEDELLLAPAKAPAKRKRVAQSDDESARVSTADERDSDLTPIEDEDEYDLAALKRTPKRKPAKKRARKAINVADDVTTEATTSTTNDAAAAEESPVKAPAKKRGRKAKSVAADGEEGFGEDGKDSPVKSPKKRKPRAPKPEPVYVIPDVEKKTTTFKGRLGFACLNTILRNRKPADRAIFCSRTCRIDSIKKNGIEWVKELGRQNVKDLLKLIEWNEENNIRFMRMSSEMFPFASHPVYGYSLEYCAEDLAAVGALASKYGHRLTTHPGQFTQLGSPKPDVVENAIRDLSYHCEMIDRMGLGKDSVMIIHGGGTYGDKQSALDRIRQVYTERLPENIKGRLVLENDEMCYSAEDLLPLCEELSIPLVFDYHHDWILPSSIPRDEIISRANAIFARKGIKPKQHLSEPRPGAETVMERRAHADRCQSLPEGLPDDMDLMIEAKDKEQAVFHLYRIYDLQPVIHANLRPPAEHETKETKGRKSHKPAGTGRKKAVTEGVVAEEEVIKGEDPAVEMDDQKSTTLGQDQVGSERAPEKIGVKGVLEAAEMVSPKKASRRSKRVKVEDVKVEAAISDKEDEGMQKAITRKAKKMRRTKKDVEADEAAAALKMEVDV